MINIGPLEIILILIVLLLIFGPSKLPEIGRQIGKAVREYRRATSEITEEITASSEEKLLFETARKLGISTEGKTAKQIAEEILKKAEEARKGST